MTTFLILLVVILSMKTFLLSIQILRIKKELKTEREKNFLFEKSSYEEFSFYKAFLDSVYGVAIIVTDTKGVIKLFNKGAQELLGYKSEEVINLETPMLFHEKDEIEKRSKFLSQKLHKPVKGFDTFVVYSELKGHENREWIYIQKNGNKILVDLYVSPVMNKQNELLGYVGLAKDINERLKYEKNLKTDIKLLHKKLNEKGKTISLLNKELRTVTYNLSHGIKTPLHGINQITQWLLEDYKDILNSDIKELLRLLSERVEKLNGLINNLLEYTNIKKEYQKNDLTDLNEVVKNIIKFIDIPKNIEIIITSKFPVIPMGKKYIESVFFNLIENSVKYMDKPKGYVEIGLIELKKDYLFFVKDNGPGIEERYHEKVFDMFQSLDEETNIENLGVGLSLAKKIIEIHGGIIKLESRLGEGTSVFFTLPINK